MDERVDVVIRTAGEHERGDSLQRAILSVVNQQGVAAQPVVVIIGEKPEPAAAIASRCGARVCVVGENVSPGRALSIGRNAIDSEFYAFLDDDDELLPHALATRLGIMRAEPAVDIVATTGYLLSGDGRCIHIPDITRHQNDLLNGIIERCWLPSCGGLFRASAIPRSYFDDLPDLCEWTCLAFRLALEHRNVRFVDVPTYNVHDTPGSLSKRDGFLEATLRVLDTMRLKSLPASQRASLERKYHAVLHDASEHYRQTNELRKAWRYHLRSLKPPHTLRYVAYTRKLLLKGRNAGLNRQAPCTDTESPAVDDQRRHMHSRSRG